MTDAEKRLKQEKYRLEEALARDRVKERKARTHRLIKEGALTHHLTVGQAVVLAVGKPCALAEGSANSLCSFAVNSDSFVVLQNNAPIKSGISAFHTLSEFR